MKTPTLKSIEKKYRNAKEVKSIIHNEIFEVDSFTDLHYNYDKDSVYVRDSKGIGRLLWFKNKYAEIISYIEPTTKVKNSVLLQLADNNSYSEEILKKECPKLFENKLEVGNWYKCLDMGNLIYYKSDNKDNYGLSYYKKEWSNDLIMQKAYKFELATPQEVETALIQEAKNRGFVDGAEYKNQYSSIGTIKNNCWNFNFKCNRLSQVGNTGKDNHHYIFNNGKWVAEIIETPSDIITIIEKYGKDELQKYLDNYKN